MRFLPQKRFFDKAMGANGDLDKVAMDKSGANKAAIDAIDGADASSFAEQFYVLAGQVCPV